MPVLANKRCSICKTEKPLDEFPNNRAQHDGKQARCRACDKTYLEQWRAANPERHAAALRRNQLRRRYGITVERYDELLEAQGGVCAICARGQVKRLKYLAVDHDHETGEARGLLCNACNAGIGFFGDRPALLLRATQYLSNWMN